jgi:hypothetical protein
MKIKTTLRFHLTSARIATTGVGEDVGNNELLYFAGGNAS